MLFLLFFMLIFHVLEHLKIILIQFAKVHHLEVRDHLFVLLVQEFTESFIRDDGDEEHVEFLECDACAILIIDIQQTVKIQLTLARSVLEN